jgi:Flp pilus assembly protein TadD
MIHLGSAFLLQGKTEEAITYFKKALSIDPQEPNALNGLKYAQAQLNKRR